MSARSSIEGCLGRERERECLGRLDTTFFVVGCLDRRVNKAKNPNLVGGVVYHRLPLFLDFCFVLLSTLTPRMILTRTTCSD